MSYKQAMKWHRKHPKGIKNLYFGFDCGSRKVKTKEETRDFYPEYVAWHKKNNDPDYKISTLTEYVLGKQ